MFRKYKAIFFDWDGTAVVSRDAPVDAVVCAMKPLLRKKTALVIVSGTTYDKIANGKIHEYFTTEELEHLYLVLGRGAFNYRFRAGRPEIFSNCIPEKEKLLKIHDVCYQIHRELLEKYDLNTDIVFSRPNYCKIDLMVDEDRGDQLFMQEDEIGKMRKKLQKHGLGGGLKELITLSEKTGRDFDIKVSATCDAKYLEVGISSKSENVNVMLDYLKKNGIFPEDCSFWGDEYVGIEKDLYGSDSYMCTEQSKKGDFFDVSSIDGDRPPNVKLTGGGTGYFLSFLKEQAQQE